MDENINTQASGSAEPVPNFPSVQHPSGSVEPIDAQTYLKNNIQSIPTEFYQKLQEMMNRRRNTLKVSKEVRLKQIKLKKAKRRISNKSRKNNRSK